MQQRRRRGALCFLSLLAAGFFLPQQSRADSRVSPELALFLTHNNIFRSRFAANTTYDVDKSEFSTAGFEYDLDIGLGSFFRRYVFKDPNDEKSKFVTIRLGYVYIPDLRTDDTDADEQRALTDITLRLPIGNAWLLSDRNRGENRHVAGADTFRYRNRLRIERNVVIGGFRFTPYVNGEAYLDGEKDEWNQIDGTTGMEFPWRHSTILELYFTWQFHRNNEDNQIAGITLQKHL